MELDVHETVRGVREIGSRAGVVLLEKGTSEGD